MGLTCSVRTLVGEVAAAVGIGLTAEKSIKPMNMATKARLVLDVMFEVYRDIYRTQNRWGGRNKGVFN